jgi:hypothetical protein
MKHLNGRNKLSTWSLGLLCVLALTGVAVAAGFFGAIFTSLGDGTAVNMNLYADKSDVYLNGGPQNLNANGLPNGTYYFQVTDPSGATLLSSDPAICRQLQVVGGKVAGAVGPCPHLNGATNIANGSTPVQLIPYNDTPNNGGEYKVWLIPVGAATIVGDPSTSPVLSFTHDNAKSDNFKVGASEPPPNPSSISGMKFYDANANGVKDEGEAGIHFWQIWIYGGPEGFVPYSTTTDASGDYSFLNLDPGTYGACEVLPKNAPIWLPTTATRIDGIAVPPDSTSNDFGNVCLGPGGGLTLGFWSNKNGQAVMTNGGMTAELLFLSNLNLRNANGTNFNPTTYTGFRTWILNATATNMSYMLSAQLAAMELNVHNGKVSGGAHVFAGSAPAGCSVPGLSGAGFIGVNDLMADANTELGLDGFTPSGDPERTCQEFKKTTLDKANNNLNFVQANACQVNYSGLEPSCVPVQ